MEWFDNIWNEIISFFTSIWDSILTFFGDLF